MRNRHTERAAIRAVRARVPEKSDPLESGQKHIRRTEQSRVSGHEDHDRSEGTSKMREMRRVSSGP